MLYSGALGSGPKTSDLELVTLGLFLGVLAPLSLADRVASALGLWSRVDWW
jgi:hypothetical protein